MCNSFFIFNLQLYLDTCLSNSASGLSPPMDHIKMDYYSKIKYKLWVWNLILCLHNLLTDGLCAHLSSDFSGSNRNTPPSPLDVPVEPQEAFLHWSLGLVSFPPELCSLTIQIPTTFPYIAYVPVSVRCYLLTSLSNNNFLNCHCIFSMTT